MIEVVELAKVNDSQKFVIRCKTPEDVVEFLKVTKANNFQMIDFNGEKVI